MKPNKSHRSRWTRMCNVGLLLIACFAISACSHEVRYLRSTEWVVDQPTTQALIADIRAYQYAPHVQPSELPAAMMQITPQMSADVLALFNGKRNFPRELAAKRIADWLIAEDGHNMKYDINANLAPAAAYAERRANCLTFTLLLKALTHDIGIPIHINEVDIPTNWGLNDADSMVFYRHVNAIQSANGREQVFDLALDQYRFEYPQRRISLDHGYAQLLSNQAVDALKINNVERAQHLMKLALSIFGDDANLWVNYGVINEHLGNEQTAELAFRYALAIDPSTLVAVTNLARFLNKHGVNPESDKLHQVAHEIRRSNPYYHFLTAQENIKAGDMVSAREHINTAIRLHNQDARFYAVRSHIALADKRYRKAYVDMQKAYRLSQFPDERAKFLSKAAFISSQSNIR